MTEAAFAVDALLQRAPPLLPPLDRARRPPSARPGAAAPRASSAADRWEEFEGLQAAVHRVRGIQTERCRATAARVGATDHAAFEAWLRVPPAAPRAPVRALRSAPRRRG